MVGTDAATLMEYLVSLESNTSYIASANITADVFYGIWKIVFHAGESCSARVIVNSNLNTIINVYTMDNNGNEDIDDLKPPSGIIMFYYANCAATCNT